jgi:hypothetical protein
MESRGTGPVILFVAPKSSGFTREAICGNGRSARFSLGCDTADVCSAASFSSSGSAKLLGCFLECEHGCDIFDLALEGAAIIHVGLRPTFSGVMPVNF